VVVCWVVVDLGGGVLGGLGGAKEHMLYIPFCYFTYIANSKTGEGFFEMFQSGKRFHRWKSLKSPLYTNQQYVHRGSPLSRCLTSALS